MDNKMRQYKRILTALFSIVLAGAIHAAYGGKAYKWVDKEGRVTYQDVPPPINATLVEEKEIKLDKEVRLATLEAAIEKNPVTLYSIPECESCDLARAYLKKRKVPFTEKNVDDNAVAQAEMKQKVGALTVPTIVVGEKIMQGYVRSLLAGELDAAGYPKPEPPGEQ